MKVSELIEALKHEDPERIVILAKDPEGNGYSPLANIECGGYRPENEWSGEVDFAKQQPEGYTPALILEPVN